MNLESLKSSKFEALSKNKMKYVVGGGVNATMTGSSTGSDGTRYSNDYNSMIDHTDHVLHGGGDFTLKDEGGGVSRIIQVNHVYVQS